MIDKLALICLAAAVFSQSCSRSPHSGIDIGRQSQSVNTSGANGECDSNANILEALDLLAGAKSKSDVDNARALLIDKSLQAPECRKRVVGAVTAVINAPSFGASNGRSRSFVPLAK